MRVPVHLDGVVREVIARLIWRLLELVCANSDRFETNKPLLADDRDTALMTD